MTEQSNNSENIEILRDERGRILPGQRALNPKGKPKGARHFTTLVKEALVLLAKDPTTGKSEKVEVLLAKKAVLSALSGDTQMLKTIWSYLDGMPKQSVEIDSVDDETKDKLSEIINKLNGEGK